MSFGWLVMKIGEDGRVLRWESRGLGGDNSKAKEISTNKWSHKVIVNVKDCRKKKNFHSSGILRWKHSNVSEKLFVKERCWDHRDVNQRRKPIFNLYWFIGKSENLGLCSVKSPWHGLSTLNKSGQSDGVN